ncbi:MAG: hypothetical protein IIZ18_02605, partial [Ruminococcus sp.]|nr:hypothetical protein [Ruminococcus sp.]
MKCKNVLSMLAALTVLCGSAPVVQSQSLITPLRADAAYVDVAEEGETKDHFRYEIYATFDYDENGEKVFTSEKDA